MGGRKKNAHTWINSHQKTNITRLPEENVQDTKTALSTARSPCCHWTRGKTVRKLDENSEISGNKQNGSKGDRVANVVDFSRVGGPSMNFWNIVLQDHAYKKWRFLCKRRRNVNSARFHTRIFSRACGQGFKCLYCSISLRVILKINSLIARVPCSAHHSTHHSRHLMKKRASGPACLLGLDCNPPRTEAIVPFRLSFNLACANSTQGCSAGPP